MSEIRRPRRVVGRLDGCRKYHRATASPLFLAAPVWKSRGINLSPITDTFPPHLSPARASKQRARARSSQVAAILRRFAPFRLHFTTVSHHFAPNYHPFSNAPFSFPWAQLPAAAHFTPPSLTWADAKCAHLSSTLCLEPLSTSHFPFAHQRIAPGARTRSANNGFDAISNEPEASATGDAFNRKHAPEARVSFHVTCNEPEASATGDAFNRKHAPEARVSFHATYNEPEASATGDDDS